MYNPEETADCITDIYGNSEIMSEVSSVAIFNVDFSFSVTDDFVALLAQVLKEKERENYLQPLTKWKSFRPFGYKDFNVPDLLDDDIL